MKYVSLILFLMPALLTAQGVRDMILAGSDFEGGWTLTQPNIIGKNAAPNYIDRSKAHQPVVMIQIIYFPNAKAAEEKLASLVASTSEHMTFEKVDGPDLAYERTMSGQKMRIVAIRNYWLTVEQVGTHDDREQFIRIYTDHIRKQK